MHLVFLWFLMFDLVEGSAAVMVVLWKERLCCIKKSAAQHSVPCSGGILWKLLGVGAAWFRFDPCGQKIRGRAEAIPS